MRRHDRQVGLYFTTFPEGAQVVHLVEGGSAQKSGQIRIGDMILSINGKSTAEQNVDSIRGMLNGAPGTQVVLVIRVFEAVSNKLDPANPVVRFPPTHSLSQHYPQPSLASAATDCTSIARVDEV